MKQRPRVNPFEARTRQKLDDNFPPFEEACAPPRPRRAPTQEGAANLGPTDSSTRYATSLNRSGCSTNDSEANLSIAARSVLFEHNRHIHRCGLDQDDDNNTREEREHKDAGSSFASEGAQQRQHQHIYNNSLDADWHRFNDSQEIEHLQRQIFETIGPTNNGNVINNDVVGNEEHLHRSVSTRFIDQVVASSSESGEEAIEVHTEIPFDNQILASLSESGHEAIEVLTAISADQTTSSTISDYFNSSRVHLLLTPESVRNAPIQRDAVFLPRHRFEIDDSHDVSTSVASTSLNDDEIRLRQLLRITGLPAPSSRHYASRNSSNIENQDAVSSFSLNLSHISAEGSDTGHGGNLVDFSLNQSLLSNDPLIATEEAIPNLNNSSDKTSRKGRPPISPRRHRRNNKHQSNISNSSSRSQPKLPPTPPILMRHSSSRALAPWGTPSVHRDGELSESSETSAGLKDDLPVISKEAADRASQITVFTC